MTRIGGLQIGSLPEVSDGRDIPLLPLEKLAQAAQRGRRARIQLERFAKLGFGRIELTHLFEHHTQSQPRRSLGGKLLDEEVELLAGARQLAILQQSQAEIILSFRRVRLRTQRRFERSNGAAQFAVAGVPGAEDIAGLRGRICRAPRLEFLRRSALLSRLAESDRGGDEDRSRPENCLGNDGRARHCSHHRMAGAS